MVVRLGRRYAVLWCPKVAEVGDRAGKEYGLEKTLNKMKAMLLWVLLVARFHCYVGIRQADWEPLQFDLSEKYRPTAKLKGSRW